MRNPSEFDLHGSLVKRPTSRRRGWLVAAAVTSLLAMAPACGSTTGSATNAPPNGGNNPAASGQEHDHGTKHEGGLTIGEPMPPRDDPNHPEDVRAQDIHKLGQQSVFSITGRRPDDLISSGTGFVVDKEVQHAVTNAHVVEGLAAIQGRFNDGSRGALHVIATDPCTDLAVVHFSDPLPESTKELVIGSSSSVQPGDEVTVLGYPGSLTQNSSEQKLLITTGLVNATKVVARPAGLPEFKDTIQHSATLNYGNSGGPLIDHHGRVIGINTLTNFGSRSAPAQGQFYSIAIDPARNELVSKLLKGESQNNLGWSVEEYEPGYFSRIDPTNGPALDKHLAAQGIKAGLYVKSVTPGSGPSKAGIKPGMMLTRLQSTSASTVAEMCDIAASMLPGSVAEVEGLYLLADPARFTTPFRAEFTVPGKH